MVASTFTNIYSLVIFNKTTNKNNSKINNWWVTYLSIVFYIMVYIALFFYIRIQRLYEQNLDVKLIFNQVMIYCTNF